MADRRGLKFLGFIFATVTLTVMLATGMVVKGYADGAYSLEGDPITVQSVQTSLTIAAKSREFSGRPPCRFAQRNVVCRKVGQRGRQPDKADHDTKPPRSVKESGGKASGMMADQLLRSPSAARFHCETLSAIIRVDFIAAWLSWA